MNKFPKAVLWLALSACSYGVIADDNDLLKDAQKYLDKGEVKSAVIQIKNLLQKSPDNADARLLLGETYLRLGDMPSAIKELEKVKELKMPKEKWIASLAQAYLLQNQPKKVLDEIQTDSQLPPAVNAKVLAFRGMAQLSLKDEQNKAEESFTAALKTDPENAEALMGFAMLEMSRKEFKKALDLASQATVKAPNNIQSWLLLADAKRLSSDLPGAIDAYSKAITLKPNDPRARLGRANLYISQDNLAEARKDIEFLRKTVGDSPLVLYAAGLLEFQSKKLDEAKELLAKANNLMPNHLPTSYLLGSIAFQKNELEQAEYYLSKVVAMAPDNTGAVKLLGAVRLKRGQPQEAINLLKPLAEKQQNDAQLFAMLGSAYLKNKQYDEGVNYLGKAAEIAPEVAAVRAELGLGRIASGKMEQGVEDLRSAVNIDPGLVEADTTLVLAMIQQKKFDEAIAEANKLKAKRKGDPMMDNLLGAAYMAKGDFDHARESWRNALAIKPDYTPANTNLAKLALSQNKPDDAVKEYEAILKRDPNNLAALIGLAQVSELKKDYEAMVKWLEEARQKNAKEPQPAVMLTRYYLAQGKGVKALEIAHELMDKAPDNLAALQNLGLAQMGGNEVNNAVETFKKLAIKLPDNPEVHHQLAQALFKSGDKTGAVREWEAVLRRSPEYIPALLAKAELNMQDKQYGEVMKTAEAIKSKYPKAPLGYQLEGDAYVAQKQFDKAAEAYDKAYQIAPSSYLARRLFAVRRELHKDQAAFDGLRAWLEKANKDAEAWAMLAAGLQETSKPKDAVAAYEKAYEQNPDNLMLQNNLAWLYQELGDKKALPMAEKLASASGIDSKPEILDTIGWIFLQNGKEDKGLVMLQQALLQDPRNASIHFHVAKAFAKTGKKEEAKKELEKLLKENKAFPERNKAEELLKGL